MPDVVSTKYDDPKYPRRVTFNGYHFPPMKMDNIADAFQFHPQDDDVITVAYPKTGQTWTRNIIYLLYNGGNPIPKGKKLGAVFPWLELTGLNGTTHRPRVLKTHLPFDNNTFNPNAKYVLNFRNPKDVMVSFYHHQTIQLPFEFTNGKFDDYFDMWINGEAHFNDFFEHVRGWSQVMEKPNVISLPYELMVENTREYVVKLANFLGGRAKETANDTELMDEVLKHSHFDQMSKEQDKFVKEGTFQTHIRPNYFIRKGQAKDWVNLLNNEQSTRIDSKFQNVLGGTIFESWWKPYM